MEEGSYSFQCLSPTLASESLSQPRALSTGSDPTCFHFFSCRAQTIIQDQTCWSLISPSPQVDRQQIRTVFLSICLYREFLF